MIVFPLRRIRKEHEYVPVFRCANHSDEPFQKRNCVSKGFHNLKVSSSSRKKVIQAHISCVRMLIEIPLAYYIYVACVTDVPQYNHGALPVRMSRRHPSCVASGSTY